MMNPRNRWTNISWKIEEYSGGMKQFCGVEMSKHKKRVAESASNVFIEDFSKAGDIRN